MATGRSLKTKCPRAESGSSTGCSEVKTRTTMGSLVAMSLKQGSSHDGRAGRSTRSNHRRGRGAVISVVRKDGISVVLKGEIFVVPTGVISVVLVAQTVVDQRVPVVVVLGVVADVVAAVLVARRWGLRLGRA